MVDKLAMNGEYTHYKANGCYGGQAGKNNLKNASSWSSLKVKFLVWGFEVTQ
jgi:hypothetical protein